MMAKPKAGNPAFLRQCQEFVDDWNRRWDAYLAYPSWRRKMIRELTTSPYVPYLEAVFSSARTNSVSILTPLELEQLFYLKIKE